MRFFFLSFKVEKKKDFSVPGHLKNYFHFPKCFPENSLVGGEPGCKEVMEHWVYFLHEGRQATLGHFFEVPLEASKSCVVASGL